jgi:hypothetical protein
MPSEYQLRRLARAEGLRLIKYRECSRWYVKYGPYALADESNCLVAYGMTAEDVGAAVQREPDAKSASDYSGRLRSPRGRPDPPFAWPRGRAGEAHILVRPSRPRLLSRRKSSRPGIGHPIVAVVALRSRGRGGWLPRGNRSDLRQYRADTLSGTASTSPRRRCCAFRQARPAAAPPRPSGFRRGS